LIHEDALMSYYLDYYTSQYTEGNFAQFVYNSHWNEELNELIRIDPTGCRKTFGVFSNNVKKSQIDEFGKTR
jgi:hypothetical protein